PGIRDSMRLAIVVFSFRRNTLSEMKCPPCPDTRRSSNACNRGDIGPLFGDRADGVERRGLRVERVRSNRFVIGADANSVSCDTETDMADLDDVPARGESGEEEAAGAVRHQSAA